MLLSVFTVSVATNVEIH